MSEAGHVHGPFALAYFCDDIRTEVGGKITLVGIYGSDMILPSIPAFIPKMGIALSLVVPFDFQIESVSARVELGTDEVAVFESLGPLPELPSPVQAEGLDAPTRRTTNFHFLLPPFTVASTATMRAFVTVNSVELLGAKLRIVDHAMFVGQGPKLDDAQPAEKG